MKNMKKLLIFLVALAAMLCLFVFGASAYTGTQYGNTGLYYSIRNNEAIISDAVDNIVTADIPESIDGYPVTSIDYFAFYNCAGLTSVTIGNSVTSIGASAFECCTGLTSITIPNSVTSIDSYAFGNCTDLTKINWNAESVSDFDDIINVFVDAGTAGDGIDVVFGDNVKSIPEFAFYVTGVTDGSYHPYDLNYPKIKSVIIGNSVTSIGSSAFNGCAGLTSVTIGNSVTSIGSGAFECCTGLTSITIPNSVTSIGSYAFGNCTDLTRINWNAESVSDFKSIMNVFVDAGTAGDGIDVVFGDNVKSIPNFAFYVSGVTNGSYRPYDLNYPKIKSVIIGNSVTSIGSSAFNGCAGLTSVTIGNSVTSIGSGAFECCTGLTSITIPNSVTSIGSYAFYKCTGLTSVTIGNSVTSIDGYAFYNCAGLTSVTIGNSVTSISYHAFSSCTNLTKINWNAENVSDFKYNSDVFYNTGIAGDGIDVVFGDNVKYIPAYLFYANNTLYQPKIKSVMIGNSVAIIGSYAFRGCTGLTSVTIPDSVKNINIYAFSSCTGLTNVTIGNSVTRIGEGAFYNCTGLIKINWNSESVCNHGSSVFYNAGTSGDGIDVVFGNNVKSIPKRAFYVSYSSYQPKIKSVTVSSSVTSIGSSAFEGCTSLKSVHITDLAAWCKISFISDESNPLFYAKKLYINEKLATNITIPDGVTSIGDYAFRGCSGLTSVTIPDSVTSIGDYAFRGCSGLTSITIPDSVTSIGSSAFNGCSGLTSTTIPDSVTSIGDYAFRGCTSLTSVTISDSVTSIGDYAFIGCSGLTSITIPDSVTSIGDYAFRDCTSLTSVTISDSVTSIGDYAFSNCTNLTKINWNAENVSDFKFDSSVFYNAGTAGDGIDVVFGDNAKYIPAYVFFISDSSRSPKIKSVMIGNSVTSIGDYAFRDCTSLTSVTISDSVTNICSYAFYDCSRLTSVTIPDSVTNICSYAFYDCSCLTSVTIGNNVTSIGDYAFYDCFRLTKINWNAENVSDFKYNSNVFYNAGAPKGGINVVFGDNVKSIPAYAFHVSDSSPHPVYPEIKSVVIGNSVTSIGDYAFSNCTNLTKINWNAENVSDFKSDSNVFYNAGTTGDGIDVVFGDNVKYIPAYVFYMGDSSYRPKIKSVTIGNSVTSIGDYAFLQCTGLESVIVGDSVTRVGWSAFESTKWYNAQPDGDVYVGCVYYKYKGIMPTNTSIIIKEGTKSIAESAFRNCAGLTSITIPDSVTSIGNGAFERCTGLTSITIPDSVTNIGNFAFYECTGLTSVTIPDNVTSIGGVAFKYCTGLTSVTIGNNVTSIGVGAFGYCTGLIRINWNAENVSDFKYNSNVFYNAGTSGDGIDVIFGDNVKSIPAYAFQYCTGLKSITIPDSVTSIGNSAFEDCTGLKSITIPDGITSIGSSAFEDCTGLTSVTIGSGLKYIGNIFFGCNSISILKVSDGVEKIEVGAFDNTPWYEKQPYGDVYIGSVYYKYKGTVPVNANITIKKGTKGITDKAFENAAGINTLTIPSSVTNIGEGVFALKSKNHVSIKTLIIEDLTAWCKIDFTDCYSNPMKGAEMITVNGDSLLTLTVPSEIKEIKDYAFFGFRTINKAVIPKSVKSVGTSAFYSCDNLRSVTIPGSVKTIGDSAFKDCSYLSYVELENGIETIGQKAFYDTAVCYLIIPDSVKSLGSEAFNRCYDLTNLTVGNGIEAIEENVFSGYSLTTIKIGKNVKSIEKNAFYSMRNLPEIYFADSQTAWENISIDDSNELILRATMYYDADISHKHNYDENVTKNATCTNSGSKTLTCECGKTGTQSIPAKGHTAVTDKAVSPTCTRAGKTEGSHCKVCGTVLTAQKTISATGHTYKTTKTLATVSTDGKTVTACTVCGYVSKTTTYYKASSIKLSATVFTYNGKVQKPTVTVKNSKGTTLKNGTDYTVSYASGCTSTGKYAVKVTFKGNYTGSKTLYFTILPGKTSSLTASQSTTSIKATWKAVTGASGYIVTLYNSSNKVVKTVDTTKTTYTFSKLSVGTLYKVKVTAYKTIDGKKINSRSYALLTTATKPGTPTLKVAAGAGKATLSWNKQTGATGYVVYMATSKNGKYTKIATVKGNTKVSFTKTGLTKGKIYYFKVAAYKTVGGKTIYGSFSSVKYAKIK